MYEKEIEIYQKHMHLGLASKELGIPLSTLYWRLKKVNHPVVGDKKAHGSDKDKFAEKGESFFKNNVPNADICNDKEFQSKVDFIVNGIKIDIKSSNKKEYSPRKYKRWAFSIKKQVLHSDFFVLLCFDLDEVKRIILLPTDVVKEYQTISISERGSKWDSYEISLEEMVNFFTKDIYMISD